MQTNQLSIRFGSGVVPLQGQVIKPTNGAALKKALKGWLGLWAVALLCLPVPVIHLVIPPLALLLGPFMGIMIYFKSRRMIAAIDAEISCTACGRPIIVSFRDTLPPLYGMCPHCKAGYEVLVAPN